MFQTLTLGFKNWYTRYERLIPIIAFVCGFIFDMSVLHRIDEPSVIIQQAGYLLFSCILISVELIEHAREIAPPRFLAKVWRYREFLLHFLLGTLLNSYTIFYFKSASSLTSFIFIIILVVVLTVSEFKRFGQLQTQVHMGLWSLCLVSYFQSLLPILFGFMGIIPFLASGISSILVFLVFYRWVRPKLADQDQVARTHVIYPYVIIQTLFTAMYFARVIPPVPLSVSYLGIYHSLKKENGNYLLSYSRPEWKFWQHGDETFYARPGDTVIAYMQVFSPSRFQDQLQVRWSLYDQKRGFQSQDAIPLQITGGREQGYRAVTQKNHYQPGLWRVQVETMDSHEVGRLDFTIVNDDGTTEREFHNDIK